MKSKSSFFDVIILAGGESKRFGSDKCCFEYNGKTFLERIAENFDNPIIVTHVKRNVNGIQIIDKIRKGPVEAVKLALPYLTKDKVFITGCDFPFITRELAYFICEKEGEISLIYEEFPQPLLACYSTSLIKENIQKVRRLLDLTKFAKSLYYIGTYELLLHGFLPYHIKNINSWIDFSLLNQYKYTLSVYIIK